MTDESREAEIRKNAKALPELKLDTIFLLSIIDDLRARHAATERDACRWAERCEATEKERDDLRAPPRDGGEQERDQIKRQVCAQCGTWRSKPCGEGCSFGTERVPGETGFRAIAALAAKEKP